MSVLGTLTLDVHVAAGTVAVLAGIGAMVTGKGGRRHRQAGRVFVLAMGVVVGTSLLLAALAPTAFRLFLALVAVFSGYMAFSGYRVLSRKRPADDPEAVDWVAAAVAGVACLALAGWGVVWVLGGSTFGAVLVVFGTIGLGFAGGDARGFLADDGGGNWTVAHLQRMLGALVATVSAVSAVNLGSLGPVAWLWPTVVFVPLIAYWSRRYDAT